MFPGKLQARYSGSQVEASKGKVAHGSPTLHYSPSRPAEFLQHRRDSRPVDD